MAADYDYLFKLLIIGNSGVGKSSLLMQLVVRFVQCHCYRQSRTYALVGCEREQQNIPHATRTPFVGGSILASFVCFRCYV